MEKSKRLREMERWYATCHWWPLVLALAVVLLIGAVINLFARPSDLSYATCLAIAGSGLIALYVRSVRRIERVMASTDDGQAQP